MGEVYTTSSQNLLLRLVAALFLTILYAIFLLDNRWGLGFPLVNLAFILTFISVVPRVKNSKESLFYLLASFILSLFPAVRSFDVGLLLTIPTVYLLNTLAAARAGNDEPLTIKGLILVPISLFIRAITELAYWVDELRRRYPARTEPDSSFLTPLTIFRGILIAIPLIFLFGVLFVSADPLFEKLLIEIIPKISLDWSKIRNSLELIFIFGLFSSLLRGTKESFGEFSFIVESGKYKTEISIATIAVATLIGLFLFVQAQYLFAGETLLKELGLTHSEYTRRGFAELVTVSTISLFLVAILVQGRSARTPLPVKTIAFVFIFEVLLLLGSATRRVYLYQDNFGFTQARLLGFLFSIWLAGTLLVFLIRLIEKLRETQLFFSILVNSLIVLFLMNLINIDYTVGVVKKPNLGYGIDYPYIANLSSDAWPAWEETLSYFETTSTCSWRERTAILDLQGKLKRLRKQSENAWHNGGAWVASDMQALRFLEKNSTRLNSLKDKFDSCLSSRQLPPIPSP